MQVEQAFLVGIQDVGENNEITNKAILEALTNTAIIHGNIVNQGIHNIKTTHITWVVLNWKLEVYKRPKVCETILVRTWAQEYCKIQANRDFEVLDEKGNRIAKATSKWVAINTETQKVEKLTEEMMSPYKSEINHNYFPNYEFEKINEDELQIISEAKFKICKSMIDYNNHVHNTSYLDIAIEALPSNLDKVNFNHIEICYKKEIKPNETVSIKYAIKDTIHYILIKDNEEKRLHSIIKLY